MPIELHRARLRVEIGRLRKAVRTLADVMATKDGFALVPRRARKSPIVLARPVEEEHAAVLAFLADGEFWSSRRSHSRSAPASAPCSGHSMSLQQEAKSSRSARRAHAAG